MCVIDGLDDGAVILVVDVLCNMVAGLGAPSRLTTHTAAKSAVSDAVGVMGRGVVLDVALCASRVVGRVDLSDEPERHVDAG